MIEDVRAALLGDHEAAKRLAEAERYAARLETMCKGQDKQLMEVQEGARELQLAMDGVLMAAELEHGEAVKNDQTGEIVGWRRILSRGREPNMSIGQINLLDEIIVDNFAGGGGASTGIELATGRVVDIAINHDPDAILMHRTNHPHTTHYQASVWDVDPVEVCQGRPVGLAWFSPDCKHFSKAKGGKPVDKNIRGLAWIVLRWAGTVRPRVIILENVEEFQTWGPVRKGKPVKKLTGQTFRKWLDQLRNLATPWSGGSWWPPITEPPPPASGSS